MATNIPPHPSPPPPPINRTPLHIQDRHPHTQTSRTNLIIGSPHCRITLPLKPLVPLPNRAPFDQHKHDKHDNLYAFAFPGSDARIRIPRFRGSHSHGSQGPMRAFAFPGSDVTVTTGLSRARHCVALSAGVQWDCGNQSRETRRL